MKVNIIVLVGFILFAGCNPSAPQKPIPTPITNDPKQLIRSFDSCYLKYARHSIPRAKIPEIYPNPFFTEIFKWRDTYTIDYYVSKRQKNGNIGFRVTMFTPYDGTREQLIRTLLVKSIKPDSRYPEGRKRYIFYDQDANVGEDDFVLSYYNEIIYIFDLKGPPDEERVILQHAFECIDIATRQK